MSKQIKLWVSVSRERLWESAPFLVIDVATIQAGDARGFYCHEIATDGFTRTLNKTIEDMDEFHPARPTVWVEIVTTFDKGRVVLDVSKGAETLEAVRWQDLESLDIDDGC